MGYKRSVREVSRAGDSNPMDDYKSYMHRSLDVRYGRKVCKPRKL
jgi:hypothetical protein